MREHRGDGHVACLTHAGLDGVEAIVLHAASGAVPAEVLRVSRNWSQQEWSEAEHRLVERGLVAGDTASAAGAELRADIEADTNRLAAQPFAAIGAQRQSRSPADPSVSRPSFAPGGFPSVNPIGLDAWPE